MFITRFTEMSYSTSWFDDNPLYLILLIDKMYDKVITDTVWDPSAILYTMVMSTDIGKSPVAEGEMMR